MKINLHEIFQKVDIDIKSVIYTLIVIPLFLFVRRLILKYMKEWGEYIIDGFMYILSRYIKHSIAASLSLKRYCKLQMGNESVKFLNIPSSLDLSLDIDKIFVNLTISYTDEQERDFSHSEILNVGNRITVMGDPGSGKSSLIKRLFRSNCQLALKHPRRAKLPILIELKNIAPDITSDVDIGLWFYNYIKGEVTRNKVYKIQDCFENYVSNKGLLVLLDGLDEVSSINYPKICECINKLSDILNDSSENNTIVLTMRSQFYQQVKLDYSINFPHKTFLRPFTPSDIFDFLSRWHFEKDAERNISRVYKDLTDRPTLREMCSNPLILSMYVAEDQISNGNISPESRTQFYRKITEELIIKRRLMQKSNIPGSYSSLKEQRERILGRIAYEHLINLEESSNTLSWAKAIVTIKEILKCNDEQAHSIFDEIAKETGLISEERRRESFRFIHLTFCEFLGAFEIQQGLLDGWGELLKFHKKFFNTNLEGKTRLMEVIPFAVGLLPRAKREQALFDVAKLNDATLMSRCFLECKLYNHKTWPAFLTNSKKKFLALGNRSFDERWLQDLHVFNVVVRDANLSAESIKANDSFNLSEFYESLLDREKTTLNQILASFASQDAAAVFRLAEIGNINLLKDFPTIIIQNCDQLPFLGLVKEKIVQSNENESSNWSALLCEAALQKKLVSQTLDSMSYSQELDDRICRLDNYRVWYLNRIINKTFYTQCLTIASHNTLDDSLIKTLNLLLRLKAPTEHRLRRLTGNGFVMASFFFMAICSYGFLLKFSLDITTHNLKWQFFYLFLSVTVYSAIFFFANYRSGVTLLYRSAINLKSLIGQKPTSFIQKIMQLMLTLNRFSFLAKKDRGILNALIAVRDNSQ